MAIISIIAAQSDNGVIGRDNRLPWHIKSDLENFRDLTIDKPVVMGRKTFESLRLPLDRRDNIVVTRDPNFSYPGVAVFRSVEEAIQFAKDIPAEEIMVIGGEQIFRATLNEANKMYLTLIHTIINDGDAFFPKYNTDEWNEIGKRALDTGDAGITADFHVL